MFLTSFIDGGFFGSTFRTFLHITVAVRVSTTLYVIDVVPSPTFLMYLWNFSSSSSTKKFSVLRFWFWSCQSDSASFSLSKLGLDWTTGFNLRSELVFSSVLILSSSCAFLIRSASFSSCNLRVVKLLRESSFSFDACGDFGSFNGSAVFFCLIGPLERSSTISRWLLSLA